MLEDTMLKGDFQNSVLVNLAGFAVILAEFFM